MIGDTANLLEIDRMKKMQIKLTGHHMCTSIAFWIM